MKQTTTTATKRVSPRKTAVTTKAAPRKAITTTAEKVSPFAVAAGTVRKFHIFVEGARPVSGPRLTAHTNAVLLFLRLAEMIPAKKNAVLALLGTRAVNYHHKIGNFEDKADCVTLTKQGYTFFKSRVDEGKVDGALSAAFLAAIQKGKASELAQIKPHHLVPVAMPTN